MSEVQTISALPVPFTPPPSCLDNIYTIGDVDLVTTAGGGYVLKGWTSDCYPKGAPSETQDIGVEGTLTNYYASYVQTACFGGYTSRSGLISDGTTSVFCCPSAIEWNDRPCERYQPSLLIPVTLVHNQNTFTSHIASLHWPPVTVIYRNNIPPSFGIAAATFGNVMTPLGGGSVATTAVGPTTGAAPTSRVQTATGTGAAPSSTSSSPSDSSDGFSTGTKVGIGLGAAAGFLILLILLLFLIRKRRARSKNPVAGIDNGQTPMPGWWNLKAELDADQQLDVVGNNDQALPVEADSRSVPRPELDSGWSGREMPTEVNPNRRRHAQ